jgi:cyanophycinase-like exopeptidase
VLSGLSSLNAPKVIGDGAVQFVEKTDGLFDNTSKTVVDAVEIALSRGNRLHEVGWH